MINELHMIDRTPRELAEEMLDTVEQRIERLLQDYDPTELSPYEHERLLLLNFEHHVRILKFLLKMDKQSLKRPW
jgi:hypothetical protein